MASVGAVLFLAYATTLGALGLWTRLLSRYSAAAVAPFGLLVPVFGILSTHMLLGEQITRIEIVGSGLVFAAQRFGGLFGRPQAAGLGPALRFASSASSSAMRASRAASAAATSAASNFCGICCGQLVSHAEIRNRIACSGRAL